MAEAAATLAPGMVLTGMRNLRAFRWIILEQGVATLHVTAKRRAGVDGSEFDVAVRVLPEATAATPSGPLPASRKIWITPDEAPDVLLEFERLVRIPQCVVGVA